MKRMHWALTVIVGLWVCLGIGCGQDQWNSLRYGACSAIAFPALLPSKLAAWALNGRGLSLYPATDLQAAIKDLERAVALHPDKAVYQNNLGNAYRLAERLADADRHYSRALTISPAYGRAHLNRGMVRLQLGLTSAALLDVDRSVALQPNASAPLTVRGNIKLLMRDTVSAMSDQNKAIALNPDFAVAWSNRACVHLVRGEVARAALDRSKAACISRLSVNKTATCSRWQEFGKSYSRLRFGIHNRELLVGHGELQSITCIYSRPASDEPRAMVSEPAGRL